MPIYDYKCHDCDHVFEKYTSIDNMKIDCPNCCGKYTAERMIGAPAFHLKGRGWAKDGYTSKNINPEKPNK